MSGILHYRGFIKDPTKPEEIFSKTASARKLDADDSDERKKIIALFEAGQL